MRKRQPKRCIAEINLVPYIDVMLVLLVIFMVTAPLLSQGVNVDLPKAQAQTISGSQREPIVVSVDSKGNYYLNIAAQPDNVIDPNNLAASVTQALQNSKQKGEQRLVLVKADKNVDYGRVMQAMVLLQQAGAGSVGLVTDDPSS
jgi:biopolymer transport protein TolR